MVSPNEPYPPPGEATPPQPAVVPEPYPPPDEGTPPTAGAGARARPGSSRHPDAPEGNQPSSRRARLGRELQGRPMSRRTFSRWPDASRFCLLWRSCWPRRRSRATVSASKRRASTRSSAPSRARSRRRKRRPRRSARRSGSSPAQIHTLEGRVGDVSSRLSSLQSDLALRAARLHKLNELFQLQTQRLRYLKHEYTLSVQRLDRAARCDLQGRDPTTIDLIITAKSFQDVLDQLDYFGAIAKQDKQVAAPSRRRSGR